jgi:L-ribulose-5-phosphate 3-epimerase
MNISVIVSGDNRGIEPKEMAVDLVKKVGFDRVFIHWKDYECNGDGWEFDPDYIKKADLDIIFAHLSYKDINLIWNEVENVDNLIEGYFEDISECKKYRIPMVVMHLTTGFDAPIYNEKGIDRLKRLVEHAKKLGIKIAFENTKMRGYLEYVLTNIKDENVGVCFDSGHYHAYFNDEFDFLNFKNRIFAVHLHDNDKSDDQHLLPFDGTIDWLPLLRSLKECNFSGDITLESIYRNKYLELMSPLDFYRKSYIIANKLVKMYESRY